MNVRLSYFIILFFVASILAVGATTLAWNAKRDLKGTIQLSSESGSSAMLNRLGNAVIVRNGSGGIIWTYKAKKPLSRAMLSADGKWVAATGNGVRLLSVAEKKEVWAWEKDGRNAVAISPDGKWIAAGGNLAKAYLFQSDSAQPKMTWALDPKDDSPKSIAISDDGKTIAVVGNLGVYMIDGAKSSVVWRAKPSERVEEVRMSGDGRYILGIAPHSINLWDRSSAKTLWQKTWKGSLIGAAMTASGDTIAVSHGKGMSVFNIRGEELRTFENAFGNSDLAMSANGRYIYVNSGSRRLYAFDDSYSQRKLRPFRIIRDINSGGHRGDIVTDSLGSIITYPKGDSVYVEESKPAVLSLSPSIPLLIKEQTLDMGAFVTNPGTTSRNMSLRVTLSLPASLDWWKNISGKISDKEPSDIRSKLIEYTLDELGQTSADVHTEDDLIVGAGSSIEKDFSITVPDLASGAVFDEYIGGAMNKLNPISLVSTVLGKIQGPLSKLIGKEAASYAIVTASRTISAASGEMIFPVLGMGTVVLYDEAGKPLDHDSFYFMYLR
ncbi:MAG: hypothetical protein WC477_03560 [Patescibacteria group bacterium]